MRLLKEKRQNGKQWWTKQYRENSRLSNTHFTKNWASTQWSRRVSISCSTSSIRCVWQGSKRSCIVLGLCGPVPNQGSERSWIVLGLCGPVPDQGSERSCIVLGLCGPLTNQESVLSCIVLGIVVLLLPTIFLLHFRTVLTVSYIFVFDFLEPTVLLLYKRSSLAPPDNLFF
jgi:hypothetical protein